MNFKTSLGCLCLLSGFAPSAFAASAGPTFYGDPPDDHHPWAVHDGNRPQPRFADAVLDPELFRVVRAAARRRSPLGRAVRDERIERALQSGPAALSAAERRALLSDADALASLYRAVRTAPVHPGWTGGNGKAGRATISVLRGRPETRHRPFQTLARPG